MRYDATSLAMRRRVYRYNHARLPKPARVAGRRRDTALHVRLLRARAARLRGAVCCAVFLKSRRPDVAGRPPPDRTRCRLSAIARQPARAAAARSAAGVAPARWSVPQPWFSSGGASSACRSLDGAQSLRQLRSMRPALPRALVVVGSCRRCWLFVLLLCSALSGTADGREVVPYAPERCRHTNVSYADVTFFVASSAATYATRVPHLLHAWIHRVEQRGATVRVLVGPGEVRSLFINTASRSALHRCACFAFSDSAGP